MQKRPEWAGPGAGDSRRTDGERRERADGASLRRPRADDARPRHAKQYQMGEPMRVQQHS